MDKKKWNYDIASFDSLPALVAELNRCEIKEFHRYCEVKRFLQMKAREKGVPLSGTFELTPLCNLDCKMCYVHLSPGQIKDRDLLPVQTWKDMIDEACAAGMVYARLTGGECLTYPHFDEVYMHLQSHGVEIGVLTNGLLLSQERVDFFIRNPPAYLQITLYGSDEEAYERVTGHRAYARAVEGIRRVKEAGIPVMVCITPSIYTKDAKRMMDMIGDMGLTYRINAGMFAAREETGRTLETYDLALDDYISIMKYDAELSGRAVHSCPEDELPHQRTGTQGKKGIGCAAGRSAFSIAWDGTMRCCNVLMDISAHPLQVGFLQAWREINQTACEYPLPVECEGCGYQGACKHCVAEHRQGAERGHANPAVCAWGRRMVREGLVALPANP